MPVKAVGNKLVEVATGKVVATAKSAGAAKVAAAIRNAARKGPKHLKKLKKKLRIL